MKALAGEAALWNSCCWIPETFWRPIPAPSPPESEVLIPERRPEGIPAPANGELAEILLWFIPNDELFEADWAAAICLAQACCCSIQRSLLDPAPKIHDARIPCCLKGLLRFGRCRMQIDLASPIRIEASWDTSNTENTKTISDTIFSIKDHNSRNRKKKDRKSFYTLVTQNNTRWQIRVMKRQWLEVNQITSYSKSLKNVQNTEGKASIEIKTKTLLV